MAISFIGSATATSSSAAALTLTLPVIQQSDYIVVGVGPFVGVPQTVTSSSGAAYTPIIIGTSTAIGANVWGRFASSLPDGFTLISSAVVQTGNAAWAMVFRGVDLSVPIDATPVMSSGVSSTPDSPSITVNTANAAILSVVGFTNAGTLTPPSSFLNVTQASTNGTVNGMGISGAWILNASTSPYNPTAWGSTFSPGWDAVTVALREIQPFTWQQITAPSDLDWQRTELVGY